MGISARFLGNPRILTVAMDNPMALELSLNKYATDPTVSNLRDQFSTFINSPIGGEVHGSDSLFDVQTAIA